MLNKLLMNDGNTLSYAEYGDKDGYPVFVHHGLVGSIAQEELKDKLKGLGVRLIYIARPGYGESTFCDMNSYVDWLAFINILMNKLEINSFDVLGMSAGAPYCYMLGALMPEQVRNIYIYSGLAALSEDGVINLYPKEANAETEFEFYRNSTIGDIAKVIYDLYLASLPKEVLELKDFKDSMANGCFGMAREAKLQAIDWGFRIKDVKQPVYMQHSKTDNEVPFEAALKTSELLPNCNLHVLEDAPHYSDETLENFINYIIEHLI